VPGISPLDGLKVWMLKVCGVAFSTALRNENKKNKQRQKQIPPLRCGMTNQKSDDLVLG
jgi:hypothetical protein